MGERVTIAWAIQHWTQRKTGEVYPETIRRTRAESIACFKEQYDISDKTWTDDRRYRVHRAVIVTIAPAERAALKENGDG